MLPMVDQDGLHLDCLWRLLYFLNDSFVFRMICSPFVTNGGFGLWLFRDLLFSFIEQINREGRREHRVLIDKVDEFAEIEIFESVGLKDKRYLCTSF
jgi:hypothetical protein